MANYKFDAVEENETEDEPGTCIKILRWIWTVISCLFSHIILIGMVVSYCYLGAYAFQRLEEAHEKEVKKNISKIRETVSWHLWNLSQQLDYYREENFTKGAVEQLTYFESQILNAMLKLGWDGEEDENSIQWTEAGALFYSIVVITTIGYGHLTPKTDYGKVATIFYAILGIPLMLLCLSNLGDVMATSFRFLYWRVCCYFCTKKPKKRRAKSLRSIHRVSDGRFMRPRNQSFRRSMRTSTRSQDSGFGMSDILPSAHSDTELRYHDVPTDSRRGNSMPRSMRSSQTSRQTDNARVKQIPSPARGGSLDRRRIQQEPDVDPMVLISKTPILCNRYVMGQQDILGNQVPGITLRSRERVTRPSPPPQRRAQSMPRSRYLEPPRHHSPTLSDPEDEYNVAVRDRVVSRRRSPGSSSDLRRRSSPRMMTPLGYGHRPTYLDDDDDEDSDVDYYDDSSSTIRHKTRPVPIWLCLFLVVGYILAGAWLFTHWEKWNFLESAYFCFITLTTIGFGDLVPLNGAGVSEVKTHENKKISIALCSLYLLFGISLLAMSFNLVQEEVIGKVKKVAKKLGIIKSNEESSDDDD